MDDLLSEFLTETNESLATLDLELVRLEQNPNDPELIGSIFRLVHTIKGTCGFLGLPRLESVAHAGENVLGKIRDKELEADSTAVTLILACLDQIRDLLATLEQTQEEPEGDDSELIRRLNDFADGKGGADGTIETATQTVPANEGTTAEASHPASANDGDSSQIGEIAAAWRRRAGEDDQIRTFFENEIWAERFAAMAAFVIQGGDSYSPARAAADFSDAVGAGFNDLIFDQLVDHLRAAVSESGGDRASVDEAAIHFESLQDACLGRAPAAEPGPVAETVSAPEPAPAARKGAATGPKDAKPAKEVAEAEGGQKESSLANQSIRVRLDLLEDLMNMVSELVLTRNQLLQLLRTHQESEFTSPLQRLNHVTSELQEGIMKTRMQPIGNAWAKLPRLVRDLSLELNKKIDLQMVGAETELDRQVLDLIKDPLTHMVRNSADHGLETTAERRAAGKPEMGRIILKAYQEGGHIIIQIADDGAGINVERVKAKALQNGLTTDADLETLSDQQILSFIFKPGFSTAAAVTSVSGRGVGMDVVRTNIEKIGGNIEVKSNTGKGSVFTIKIPLTLAIVSALIVECSGEKFAIPQLSVLELVRASSRSEHTIERVNQTRVLRLRNRLLPLVSLSDLLQLEDGREVNDEDDTFVIVSQVGTYSFGIIVDQVFDTEEIVVKPVAPILRDITIFSGNTILGDGSVIMILDPNGIAAATGEPTMRADDGDIADQDTPDGGEKTPLLIFRAGNRTPKAVPLGLVARLEEVDFESIEVTNGQSVVQYRDRLMPLLTVDPTHELTGKGKKPFLVFADEERSMGLVVDEIVDIVEAPLNLQMSGEQSAILGSAIVDGAATDVIDAGYFLTSAFKDWFSRARGSAASGRRGSASGQRNLLLVDDSSFFRNLLLPLLTTAGYRVTSVGSAAEALALQEQGKQFDAIISDVEMPDMDGFAFVEAVRNGDRWAHTPVLALSSYTSPEDFDRGRAAGFTDYISKSDRDSLLDVIGQTLSQAVGGV